MCNVACQGGENPRKNTMSRSAVQYREHEERDRKRNKVAKQTISRPTDFGNRATASDFTSRDQCDEASHRSNCQPEGEQWRKEEDASDGIAFGV